MAEIKGSGGEGGIRTPDTLSGMPVFKFHSGFCTVRKIFYSTMFLNGLPDELVAPS
jgi:hypothetical protein